MKTQREQLAHATASPATKAVAGGVVAKLGSKAITRLAHPAMLVPDAVQLAAEHACSCVGVAGSTAQTVGRSLGVGSSIGIGAYLGAAGGPPGVAIGAAGGAAIWLIGEIAGCATGQLVKARRLTFGAKS